MPSGRKKPVLKNRELLIDEEAMELDLAGEDEHFNLSEEIRLSLGSADNRVASFYTSPSATDGANFGTPAPSEITKSGRMRKKTAKLIEMEEVDKLEKIPRKPESNRSKKPKMPKISSDRFISMPSTGIPLPDSNLSEDSGDFAPLVIANVFSTSSSAIKSSPESHFAPGIDSFSTANPVKIIKVKPKKPKKANILKNGFGGAAVGMSGKRETELARQSNVMFGSAAVPGLTTSHLNDVGITPKKSSKKKPQIMPFRIKLEHPTDHSATEMRTSDAGELSLPISSSYPEMMSPLIAGVKEELDIGNIHDGMEIPRKEKSKKKDKLDRGSMDDGCEIRMTFDSISDLKMNKKKKLKVGKQLQNTRKETEKPKKKRQKGYTAYMLWCSVQRAKVVAQNPGIDFAQISKRLGDMWQTVPEKEKMTLRRKARRMAKKGSLLMKTGLNLKDEMASMDAGHRKMLYNTKPLKLKVRTIDDPVMKLQISSVDHVDVAAHLKLLGESLTTIGARLQEHRGNIAVQGSLSVLLDSLLCTLGPLMCLTNQDPQLNGCPEEVHRSTLENIAYIMPGVG